MNAPLLITPEQLAERDLWESHLARGICSLHEALFMCLASGAPASPYLLARLEGAFYAYLDGENDDLADLFGLSMTKREKNAEKRATWVSHVRFHVDSFHDQGLSKQDPGYYAGTAFHAAAKLLHRSPSQIFDTYYGKS